MGDTAEHGLERAAEILERAKSLDGDERERYLDEACVGDEVLRAEIGSMIAASERVGDFLASPSLGGAAGTIQSSNHEKPGTIIGRYKLLELIGEGGFGAVYMAEQSEPVRRKVALKIIKLGMDTKQTLARFEAERQALAMMDHPNIAKVLDAGATETGRPYFVMELVKGVPITEYCDAEKLSTRDRLELLTRVCNAVQHAHQKGVIHRDIKPSNVLVTIADGKPIPKVIDFGIAKATGRALTDKTLFTGFRQLVGTPAYMSPEQAEMSGVDVDTRSDIYSLGVLLYELLTGTTPFEPGRLHSAALGEMQRIILEEYPDRPSTRVSTLRVRGTEARRHEGTKQGEPGAPGPSSRDERPIARARGSSAYSRPVADPSSAMDIAQHRRSDPASLTRLLRGDLDWIVMKCLEKDRARRYETANGLATDIQRHLENQPVHAGPPTAAYRFRKFARRNKAALITTTCVAGALILGLSIGGAFLWREQARTLDALNESHESRRAEEVQRRIAEDNEAVAKAVNDFLVDDLLAAVAPSSEAGRGKDVSMREVLDEAAARIEEASRVGGRFEEMPLVEASIRATLGSTYHLLGEYAAAAPHLERDRLLRRRELGEEHRDTLASMNNLAILYQEQGRYDEAEPLYVKTLKIRKRVLGEKHRETLGSMNNLASFYNLIGRYDEAELLFVEMLGLMRRVLGEEAPLTLNCSHNLATLYLNTGREDDAELLYIKTLGLMRRVFGEEAPHTLNCMENLATVYRKTGREDEAEPLFIKTLEIRKRVLGEEHPDTLRTVAKLASVYKNQGKTNEARPLVRALKAAWQRQANRPEASPDDKNDFAWFLLTCEPTDLRDPDTALPLAHDACAMTDNANPAFLDTLALAQHLTGDTPGAIETQQKALLLLPQDAGGRSGYEAALARYEAAREQPPDPKEVSPPRE